MKSMSQEELELQKNRLEILKLSGKPEHLYQAITPDDNKQLWEYELEHYKSGKRKERFYVFGALCGIASLILTVLLHLEAIRKLFI